MQCDQCGCQLLFGLSDGVRSDGDLDDPTKTVPVQCPNCFEVSEILASEFVSFNGQAK